ncbi:ATP-grasp domain-containing protein [Priestia taiwanensis]|uniref:ATP-grasp domain-containing protein n=1 Tax=Priestia taiwanensis TaxID=1347902 RepID=A0A917EM51_9BACI|nr:ATP-grasp domain-containing protein [Priestia taiwanensis]MBM7362105.1 biotin carboxylase [Priestia taiwanensis]GGE59496.1 hypothetical protein GCM10007140_07290 [Priestia taiwanensis]
MGLKNKRLAIVVQNIHVPFIFEEAEAMGINVTFFHHQKEVNLNHLKGVQKFIPIDLFHHPDKAVDIVKSEHERNPFDGIMTFYEPALEFVARLAEELRLPGLATSVIENCRNKNNMRGMLKKNGLNVPHFKEYENEVDVTNFSFEYPVVVKPSNGFASQGVTRANTKKELIESIEKVRKVNTEDLGQFTGNKTSIVIEQFIDGPEFAIETFSIQEEVRVLSIGYKGDCKGPFFEESIYIAPAQLEENVMESISQEASKAVRALGIVDGPAHVELRLDSAGKPYVIEIGARIGGSGISHYIVKASTGINYMELAFKYVLGVQDCDAYNNEKKIHKVAGNYIIPVQGHGIVEGFEGIDSVRADMEVNRVLMFMAKGTEVLPYPHFSGYPGFILTTHESYSDCERYYTYLDNNVKVIYRNEVNV